MAIEFPSHMGFVVDPEEASSGMKPSDVEVNPFTYETPLSGAAVLSDLLKDEIRMAPELKKLVDSKQSSVRCEPQLPNGVRLKLTRIGMWKSHRWVHFRLFLRRKGPGCFRHRCARHVFWIYGRLRSGIR